MSAAAAAAQPAGGAVWRYYDPANEESERRAALQRQRQLITSPQANYAAPSRAPRRQWNANDPLLNLNNNPPPRAAAAAPVSRAQRTQARLNQQQAAAAYAVTPPPPVYSDVLEASQVQVRDRRAERSDRQAQQLASEVITSTITSPTDARLLNVKTLVGQNDFALIFYTQNLYSPMLRQAAEQLSEFALAHATPYPCTVYFTIGVVTQLKAELMLGPRVVAAFEAVPGLVELRRFMVPKPAGIESVIVHSTEEIQGALQQSSGTLGASCRSAVAFVFFYDGQRLREVSEMLSATLKPLIRASSSSQLLNRRPPLVVFVDLFIHSDRLAITDEYRWLQVLPSLQLFRSISRLDLSVVAMGPVDDFSVDRVADLLVNQRTGEADISNAKGSSVAVTRMPIVITQTLPLLTIDSASLVLYKTERPLGEGGFAQVYRGNYLGVVVAVKLAVPEDEERAGDSAKREAQAEALSEAATLLTLRHPHIVNILGITLLPEPAPGRPAKTLLRVAIVQEKLDYNIASWIRPAKNGSTKRQRLEALKDVALALHFLHHSNYIHGDLKPSNILYDARAQRAKLADFGHTRLFSRLNLTRNVRDRATEPYDPPEAVNYVHPNIVAIPHTPDSPKIDIYAMGVVIAEVASGHTSFAAAFRLKTADDANALAKKNGHSALFRATLTELLKTERPRMAYIYAAALTGQSFVELVLLDATMTAALSDGLRALVAKCVNANPDERPTGRQIATALVDEINLLHPSE